MLAVVQVQRHWIDMASYGSIPEDPEADSSTSRTMQPLPMGSVLEDEDAVERQLLVELRREEDTELGTDNIRSPSATVNDQVGLHACFIFSSMYHFIPRMFHIMLCLCVFSNACAALLLSEQDTPSFCACALCNRPEVIIYREI